MGIANMNNDNTKPHKKRGRPRKYTDTDLLLVARLHNTYGWGCLRISRKLDIPRQSVVLMLRQIPTEPIHIHNLQTLLKQLISARDILDRQIQQIQRVKLIDLNTTPLLTTTREGQKDGENR